jgi:hypothetical protein
MDFTNLVIITKLFVMNAMAQVLGRFRFGHDLESLTLKDSTIYWKFVRTFKKDYFSFVDRLNWKDLVNLHDMHALRFFLISRLPITCFQLGQQLF